MNDLFCEKFVPRRENQMQRSAEKDEPTVSPRFVLILNFLISSRPLSTASKRPALPSTTNVLLSLIFLPLHPSSFPALRLSKEVGRKGEEKV